MEVQGAQFASFLLATAIVCITPGPDMLYVMSYGVSHGRASGVSAAAGVAGGMLLHTVLSAFGVSLLVSQHPWALAIFKAVGICYLVYLGTSIIRDKADMPVKVGTARGGYVDIARKAMVVNLTNPKVIIFYVTFLPQFISPSGWPVSVQLFVLGAIFAAIGFAAESAVVLASGVLSKRLAANKQLTRKVNVSCGLIMLLLAALLLFDI